jgi:hypothetical protein
MIYVHSSPEHTSCSTGCTRRLTYESMRAEDELGPRSRFYCVPEHLMCTLQPSLR